MITYSRLEIKRRYVDCYIAWFYIQERIKQVYVLDNDAFVRRSTNGLNTVCRICHLEVILSNFNVWSSIYTLLNILGEIAYFKRLWEGTYEKVLNITRRIWGLEVILRRITDWVVTLIP